MGTLVLAHVVGVNYGLDERCFVLCLEAGAVVPVFYDCLYSIQLIASTMESSII